MKNDYDAIVVGSGISGGWAAKELTERGLTVLMVERGPAVEHRVDYKNEMKSPWEMPFKGFNNPEMLAADYAVQSKGTNFDEWSMHHFVKDSDHPYQTTLEKPFQWRRGYQLGGRSLTWGRQCYRWSDIDFSANAKDGYGTDWPVRYADLKPWYDHVESFIGVNGTKEELIQLPDGIFQPHMPLSAIEQLLADRIASSYDDRRLIPGRSANLTLPKEGRAPCQYRYICHRGCSFGAYFSTQSSTLPAARKTGRLTLLTDTIVEKVNYDPTAKKVSGISCINAITGKREQFTSKIVFLNASAFNSVGILLRSQNDTFPNGLANSSGTLGKYIMDHATTLSVAASIDELNDRSYFGNRPSNFIIPRFRNINTASEQFLRGYSYQGVGFRANWKRGAHEAGTGEKLKNKLSKQGEWRLLMVAFAESLPVASNRIRLADKKDKWGLPLLDISLKHGDNEHKLLKDAAQQARAMLGLTKSEILASFDEPENAGSAVHEMGGARMGSDARTSVVNKWNQTHDIPNLFITDGAAMSSSANQNPSLTYMAFTARAAAYAANKVKNGQL
ncbi:GMC family oxidoreductase [Aestuariibacter sp. GS-14]|uniref:GMC oxidoreductase n=1 Tax=Aestuariibacter sp. GS-14 TaxID=2590670 RepID=UPI001129D6D5|nr:GMC family oxidoreductase [Aestuariibacter sp. GS-14]TPV61793.1 GMC family oxidoreductase [Aestuariibacter sp. GS-14]